MPLRVGEIQYRLGQLVFADLFRVEGNNAGTRRHTDPGAIGGHVLFGQRLQGAVIGLGQKALFAQAVQRRRLFGVEHVRRRAIAFFHDLAGQLVAAAFAHIDVNAGLGFKGGSEVVADLFVLAVVQGQRHRIGSVGGGSKQGQAKCCDGQTAQ